MNCANKLKLFVTKGLDIQGEAKIRKEMKLLIFVRTRSFDGIARSASISGWHGIARTLAYGNTATGLISIGRLKQVKLADKPGSVVDSHSSRRFVT